MELKEMKGEVSNLLCDRCGRRDGRFFDFFFGKIPSGAGSGKEAPKIFGRCGVHLCSLCRIKMNFLYLLGMSIITPLAALILGWIAWIIIRGIHESFWGFLRIVGGFFFGGLALSLLAASIAGLFVFIVEGPDHRGEQAAIVFAGKSLSKLGFAHHETYRERRKRERQYFYSESVLPLFAPPRSVVKNKWIESAVSKEKQKTVTTSKSAAKEELAGLVRKSDDKPYTDIQWERMSHDSIEFVVARSLNQLTGSGNNPRKSIILIFEGETSALAAEATRADQWRQEMPKLGACTSFTDNMWALEYIFGENDDDKVVLEFCQVLKNSLVKVVLASKVIGATQTKILDTFGMKHGLSYKD